MSLINKASGNVNSFYGKSEEPIYAAIMRDVEAFEKQSVLSKIFAMHSSKNYGEKMVSKTSASGGFKPVGEGGAVPQDDFQEGYSRFFEHETWKNGFTFTREMIEDNKLLDQNAAIQEFTYGYGRTREDFGAAILMGGVGTAAVYGGKSFNTAAADGKALFATDHASITGGADQTNVFSNAFSDDVLGEIATRMQNFTDDNGRVLAITPDTIIIPNTHVLKKAVFAAIGSEKDPDTANNALNYQFGNWNVIVWPYLNAYLGSNTGAYFVMDSKYNQRVGGLMWFDRVKLDITNEIDINNHNWKWAGYSRFIAGANNWRAIAAGGISGGTTIS